MEMGAQEDSSKDEATTGSLHTIDGIDVVTALVPEDVRQFKVTKTCARERFSFKVEKGNQLRL